MVPARADGSVGSRSYAYRLVELGGATSFFSGAGDPVVRVDALGNRTDWVWQAGHRLTQMVNPVGVATTLGWGVPGRVTVTTGAGTGAVPVTGIVEVRDGRVSAVVDPAGARTAVTYGVDGLVSTVSSPGGARTEVSWQTLPDGVTVVDAVRVRDSATGGVVSERGWDAQSGYASGYPVYAHAGALFFSGDDKYRYSTVLTDGPTKIVSAYNSQGLLVTRQVQGTTGGGQTRTVQAQGFTYPGTESGGVPDPADLPEQYNRPTTTEITHHALDGGPGTRTVAEQYTFDVFGRPVSRTAADGTVTATTYDEHVPAGGVLPVGLPLVETVTTPDGLVAETRYQLNEARTAAVVTETFTGATTVTDEAGGVVFTRTGRVEHDVTPDGFVTTERAYPQSGTGVPTTTTWDRVIDLPAGTVTVSETAAAGTDLATTVTEVSDLVHGGPVTVTDVLGNTATTSYDPAGRPVAQTTPDGNTVSVEYRTRQQHGSNTVVTTTPDGVLSTEEHDILGRVTRITDNLAVHPDTGGAAPTDGQVRVVETRTYPEPGTVTVTDPWGATTTTKQDVFGRETETTAPNGLTKITRHDDVGNMVTTGLTPTGDLTDAETTTTQTMNVRGETTTTTGTRQDEVPVLGTETRFDGFGRATHTNNGVLGTDVEFDRFSNPVTTTLTPLLEPVEGMSVADLGAGIGTPVTATRRFDEHGASIEKTLSTDTQARSGGTRELDALGRTVSETDQDGDTTRYTYTPDNLPATITTSYGQTTTNTHHPATRALLETVTESPIGDPVHTMFDYHPVTGQLTAVFDPADRAGTEITYTYDAHGNTLATRYPDGNTIRHTYDVHGRKTSSTDIAGNTTRYGYDTTGLLTTAVQTNSGWGNR